MSELDALVSIISSGVLSLKDIATNSDTEFPSLNEPFKPVSLAENPAAIATKRLIVGAAAQLIATLRMPYDVLSESAAGMYGPATLSFANDNNVADLLEESGQEGLHAKDIGKRIGVDGTYVARSLRYLATRHIFREVKPNVFANNRHSSVLVKGRSFDELTNIDPLLKYDHAPFAASLNICTDEGFRGSQRFSEFIKDSQGYSSPFNMAIQDHANLFTWYQHPDRLWRARRFSIAMKASADRWPTVYFSSGTPPFNTELPLFLINHWRPPTTAIDWNALPDGSTIVDVGGNNGSVTMPIARVAPKHRYIVQDLEPVVEIGRRHWETQWPEALRDGIVSFEAHDFFKPMPIAADVYFMRSVIHDWSDEESKKILNNIRAAAKPTSKLILFEMAAIYACQNPDALNDHQRLPDVPYPLLGNLGLGGGGHVTVSDLQMLTLVGGKERTVDDFKELGGSTGWALESVRPGPIAAFVFLPEEV